MRIRICAVVILIASLGGAPGAWAQQPESQGASRESTPSAVRPTQLDLEIEGGRVRLERPDGWIVGEASRGALVLLRAAGEEASQMEVRHTPAIPVKGSTSHFASFHTSLQKMGLKRINRREVSYSERMGKGVEHEYELVDGGKRYVLYVWHVHYAGGVWFFTGFFPAEVKKLRHQDFVDLIGAVIVERSEAREP